MVSHWGKAATTHIQLNYPVLSSADRTGLGINPFVGTHFRMNTHYNSSAWPSMYLLWVILELGIDDQTMPRDLGLRVD